MIHWVPNYAAGITEEKDFHSKQCSESYNFQRIDIRIALKDHLFWVSGQFYKLKLKILTFYTIQTMRPWPPGSDHC